MKVSPLILILFLFLGSSCKKITRTKTTALVTVEDRTPERNLEGFHVMLIESKEGLTSSESAIIQDGFLDENNQCYFEFDAKRGSKWKYTVLFNLGLDEWGAVGEITGDDVEYRKMINQETSSRVKKGEDQDIELVVIPAAKLRVWINNREVFNLSDHCSLTIRHTLFEHKQTHTGEGRNPASHIRAFLGHYDVDYFTVIFGDTTYHHDEFVLEHNDSFDYELVY